MTAVLSQVSESMFATGIEMIAKVTLILLLAWLMSVALRRASAALRHLVAAVAICLILFVPWLIKFGPQWGVPIRPSPPSASKAISTIQTETPKTPSISIVRDESVTLSRRHPTRQDEGRAQSDFYSGSQQVGRSDAALPAPIAVPARAEAEPHKMDWKLWLTATWLIGALLLLGKLVLSHIRLRQIVHKAGRVDDRCWSELAQEIERKLAVRRPVRLWKSSDIEVPITTGIFYPKIVLPAESEEWSLERRRVVLLHEFAHIQRFDALTQWLAQIAVSIYWFHPLVWWSARQMQSERERACDDFVLSAGAKASDYASDLLEFGSRARQQVAYGAALAMARRSQ